MVGCAGERRDLRAILLIGKANAETAHARVCAASARRPPSLSSFHFLSLRRSLTLAQLRQRSDATLRTCEGSIAASVTSLSIGVSGAIVVN